MSQCLEGGNELNNMYNEVQIPIKDPINPSHYKQGKYETIDIILDRVSQLPGEQAALMSNIIRYMWRYENKNGLEDLEKAQWYLAKLAEVVAEEKEFDIKAEGSI